MSVPGNKVTIKFKRVISSATDNMGATVDSVGEYYTVKGVVATLSGDERVVSSKITVLASHRIFVPYNTMTKELDEEYVVEIDNQDYNIVWVDQPGFAQKHLEILLSKVDDGD